MTYNCFCLQADICHYIILSCIQQDSEDACAGNGEWTAFKKQTARNAMKESGREGGVGVEQAI